MRALTSIVALFGLFAPTAAFSEPATFGTGDQLYDACTGDASARVDCMSYLEGFHAGYETTMLETARRAKTDVGPLRHYCMPDGVTLGQVRDIVTEYLRRAAPVRQNPAGWLVMVALEVAFPCQKSVTPKGRK